MLKTSMNSIGNVKSKSGSAKQSKRLEKPMKTCSSTLFLSVLVLSLQLFMRYFCGKVNELKSIYNNEKLNRNIEAIFYLANAR